MKKKVKEIKESGEVCELCGMEGHTANDCPIRANA